MYNKFEKEMINTLVSTNLFSLVDININSINDTIWTLQRALENHDEIVAFVTSDNYAAVKQSIDDNVNHYYTGDKGVIIHFIVFSREQFTFMKNMDTSFQSSYIKNSSIILINENTYDIGYTEGVTSYLKFVESYLQNKQAVAKSKAISQYPATFVIIILNIIVFLAMMAVNNYNLNFTADLLLNFGAMSSAKIKTGEYYRLFSAMFIHTGIIHIAFNMYALKMIGSMVERIYKTTSFIAIYIFSGLLGSLASFMFTKAVSAGASAAIFGLLGAALVYGIKMRNTHGREFFKSIFQVILINLIIGITIPNIDNYAHVGGLIGGIIIGTVLQFK